MKTLLVLLLLPLTALADDAEETLHRGAIAIGPAWTHAIRDNYSAGFAPNGFATPSKDRLSLDLLGYWTTPTNWQLGLGVTTVSFQQTVGAYSAEYADNIIGIYAAKNFSPTAEYDLTAGALVGGTQAELTVFSGNRNGRLRESAALVAPSVGFASRLSEHTKAGLRFTYYVPFGESTQLSGQDLGTSKISLRGFSVALDLIFGRF
jgi:hypothetical protein